MLDQSVPNPMAKNPNFFTHKVFAAIGLILISTITIVAGVWWYVNRSAGSTATDNSTTVKVTTTSAKPATSSATKDETADWKTYTNSSVGYTIKLPVSWVNRNCDGNLDFFAPNNEQLGVCNSGFGGIINIEKEINEYSAVIDNFKAATNLKNSTVTSVTVGGKSATKITGTSTLEGFENYNSITYVLNLGGKAFALTYFASPAWTDQTKTFEQMVSSIKFN